MEMIGPDFATTVTASNGEFSAKGLQSGSYVVNVIPSSEANLIGTVLTPRVAAGQLTSLDATLRAGTTLQGRVTNEAGRPVQGAILYLTGYETPRYRTDSDGSYVMRGLATGRHTLNIYSTEAYQISVNSQFVKRGTSVDLTAIAGQGITVDFSRRASAIYLPTMVKGRGPSLPAWRAGTGIQSRSVYSLAVDPANCNTLYAATDQGLYKSTDGGKSWRPTGLNNLLAAQALASDAPPFDKAGDGSASPMLVSAMTTDPHNSQVIYAAAWGQGIFKSTNGGQSWAKANSGLDCLWLYSIVADADNSQVLYAGGVEYPAGEGGGVFKSTNGGQSWFPVINGLGNRNVHSLAVDPGNANVIYAGTRGGIYRSYNGGNFWQPAGRPGSGYPWAIAVDPRNGQTVYAGLGGGGVYRSTDSGASWSPVNAGLANRDLRTLIIDPANSQRLYAGTNGGGVYGTTNGGGSWSPMNRGLGSLDLKALCQRAGCGIIHAGTSRGAWWYKP
jgi:photosystem II stability/assembly factor-like uncharacterized protein